MHADGTRWINEETSQQAVSRPDHQLITGSQMIEDMIEPINPSKLPYCQQHSGIHKFSIIKMAMLPSNY